MEGNWAWGCFMGLKLLFIYALPALLPRARLAGWRPWRVWLPWVVLGLHLFAGVLYLGRLVNGRSFQ